MAERFSLRARVAAAAAVAIAVAVALVGVAIVAVLGHELKSSLDRALRSRAVDVARLAASTPDLLVAPGAVSTAGAETLRRATSRARCWSAWSSEERSSCAVIALAAIPNKASAARIAPSEAATSRARNVRGLTNAA